MAVKDGEKREFQLPLPKMLFSHMSLFTEKKEQCDVQNGLLLH